MGSGVRPTDAARGIAVKRGRVRLSDTEVGALTNEDRYWRMRELLDSSMREELLSEPKPLPDNDRERDGRWQSVSR